MSVMMILAVTVWAVTVMRWGAAAPKVQPIASESVMDKALSQVAWGV